MRTEKAKNITVWLAPSCGVASGVVGWLVGFGLFVGTRVGGTETHRDAQRHTTTETEIEIVETNTKTNKWL